MATLERAIIIAAMAHAGHVDKAGQPYILHPLRVMQAMSSTEERIVAVLHDVVEDNPFWSLSILDAEGFEPNVLHVVDLLTRRQDEPYFDYIERLKPNALARKVKMADLHDNSRVERIPNPTERDWQRFRKYGEAMTILLHEQNRQKGT